MDVNLYRYVWNRILTSRDDHGNKGIFGSRECPCHDKLITQEEACKILYDEHASKVDGEVLGMVAIVFTPRGEKIYYPCSFLNEQNKLPFMEGTLAYNIVNGCILQHEILHIVQSHNDFISPLGGGTSCPRVWFLKTPLGTINYRECRVYTAQVECYKKGIERCGGDEQCKKFIEIYLSSAEDMRDHYCAWWRIW